MHDVVPMFVSKLSKSAHVSVDSLGIGSHCSPGSSIDVGSSGLFVHLLVVDAVFMHWLVLNLHMSARDAVFWLHVSVPPGWNPRS